MDEGKRYYRLGLFVVVSILALAVLLFVLGGRKLFQPTYTFETYFAESVAGLEIGSPLAISILRNGLRSGTRRGVNAYR